MKKTEQIYGVKTTYITEGEGKDMILLHGWGQNKEMMQAIFLMERTNTMCRREVIS